MHMYVRMCISKYLKVHVKIECHDSSSCKYRVKMVEYRVKLVEYQVKMVEYRVKLVEYRVKIVEY